MVEFSIKVLRLSVLLILVNKMLDASVEVFSFTRFTDLFWSFFFAAPYLGLVGLLPVVSNLISFDKSKLTRQTFKNILDSVYVATAEEVIFRLVLLIWLQQYGFDPLSSITISAVLFGLMHFSNLRHSKFAEVSFQVVYSTIFGFYFGLVMIGTESIFFPILIHFLVNAASTFIDDESPLRTRDKVGGMLALANCFIILFYCVLIVIGVFLV